MRRNVGKRRTVPFQQTEASLPRRGDDRATRSGRRMRSTRARSSVRLPPPSPPLLLGAGEPGLHHNPPRACRGGFYNRGVRGITAAVERLGRPGTILVKQTNKQNSRPVRQVQHSKPCSLHNLKQASSGERVNTGGGGGGGGVVWARKACIAYPAAEVAAPRGRLCDEDHLSCASSKGPYTIQRQPGNTTAACRWPLPQATATTRVALHRTPPGDFAGQPVLRAASAVLGSKA